MYVVSVFEDNTVRDVFDPEIYLDEGVDIYPITDAEFAQIRESGDNGLWQLVDGAIVRKPDPAPPTPPSNEIPQAVL